MQSMKPQTSPAPAASYSVFGPVAESFLDLNDDRTKRARPQQPQWLFAAGVTVAFTVVLAFASANHVMWRDEWQAWLIALDAHSLGDVWKNSDYESTPRLWHFLLYAMSAINSEVSGIKTLHVSLAAVAMFLFMAYAPLSTRQKLIFPLGYFIFYEYGVISRCYVVGLVSAFGCCIAMTNGRRNFIVFALSGAVLAQTSAYGLLLAGALTASSLAMMIYTYVTEKRLIAKPLEIAAGLAILIGAAGFSVFQQIAPADDNDLKGVMWRQRDQPPYGMKEVSRAAAQGYLPIPPLMFPFWNQIAIDVAPDTWLIVGMSLLLFVPLLFARRKAAFLLVVIFSILWMAFCRFSMLGFARHNGHLFIALVCAYWIAYFEKPFVVGPSWFQKISGYFDRRRGRIFTGYLIVLAVCGFSAAMAEQATPFSSAKQVAEFLKTQVQGDYAILGEHDHPIIEISGYLNKPIYHLSRREFVMYCLWDNKRSTLSPEVTLERINEYLATHTGPTIVILNFQLSLPPDKFVPLAVFNQSILPDSRFIVYAVKR